MAFTLLLFGYFSWVLSVRHGWHCVFHWFFGAVCWFREKSKVDGLLTCFHGGALFADHSLPIPPSLYPVACLFLFLPDTSIPYYSPILLHPTLLDSLPCLTAPLPLTRTHLTLQPNALPYLLPSCILLSPAPIQVVSQRFPQNSIGAVGSAMFLRFINPAIVSPYEAGILDKKPPPRIERGLKLMSKVSTYRVCETELNIKAFRGQLIGLCP